MKASANLFHFTFFLGLLTLALFLSPTDALAHADHIKPKAEASQTTTTSAEAQPATTEVSSHAVGSDESAEDTSDEDDEYADDEKTISYRSIKYAGKFHPILVHFPIAFLLGGVFMQWIFIFTRKKQIPPIVTTMLWMGTLGAIVAASAGWAYAYDSMYFGNEDIQRLELHRWLGTGTAVAAVVTLILKRFLKPILFAFLLTALAALVGAAAHQGGSLTYGADNFSEF